MNAADQPNTGQVSPATQEPGRPSPVRPRELVVVLSFILAALVFAAFQPALKNDFIAFDDSDYVTSNATVLQGLTWAGMRWAFASTEAANWHPLTWISHMVDVQLFGLNPMGHHLTSILLHTVSSVLLYLTLRALTGAMWRSLIVAALFGLHPLRVESVVWVAERKDALSTVFWFLTIFVYTHYVRALSINRNRAKTFYALTLLCFAFGLMAKPMLVTLPFALLLLDVWPLHRVNEKKLPALVLEKLPLFALSFVSCIITFLAQRRGGSVDEVTSLGYRLGNVFVSFVRYLGKIFWPTDLAFFYPHPQQWPTVFVAVAALLILIISVLALRLRQRQPGLLVAWFWFLGTLVPVIGLVQVGQQSIADRYTYIPSVGILIALIWGSHALVADHKQLVQAVAIIGGIAAVACLLVTRQQTRVWKDTESLCRHSIKVSDKNYLAHDLLGDTLFKSGKREQGLQEQLRALEIRPGYAEGHNNLAVNLKHEGRLTEAIEHFQRALQLRPRYPEAHFNLGVALEAVGQLNDAQTEYSRAITQKPAYADAHYNLGLLYAKLGRFDQAVSEFQTTLSINPNLADAHNNLGVTLDRMGRLNEAIRHYQLAIVAKPDYPRAHFNLGVALTRSGQLNNAASAFEAALRLKPDYLEALTNLAAIRAAMNPDSNQKP